MTVRVQLAPTLDSCIETTARREFARSADELMRRGGRNSKLEQRIELLRWFLETADFRRLREESEPHLVAGRAIKFILRSEGAEPAWKMAVR